MEKVMRALMFVILLGLAMETNARTENFDKAAIGSLPQGWKTGVTGEGTGYWAVEDDASAPSPPRVLRQIGRGTFPWAVKENTNLSDGFVEVKFKAISGKEDQAGGVMWRWKSGDTYYVARANALENNVSLYYTTNGRRNTIKYVKAPVPRDAWHTLRVEFNGSLIKVSLNGKLYIEEKDTHITGSGAVGLWTKADSNTAFDDFAYGSAK
jgi:Domain of Unknown Function (DUF1080)